MTEIKKLLFVTKFEELTFDVLKSLLGLQQVALNHVVFAHVIEREKVSMFRRTDTQKKEMIRLREMANIRFIDWAEDLFERGLEVGVYIVVGNLVSEVIKASGKEDPDLIVVGRPHKGVLEQLYSGSDVTEIIRRTAVPILVFKHLTAQPTDIENPFRKPLLAMDWSPASLKALDYLDTLKPVIEKIDVIHVASESDFSGSSVMEIQKLRKVTRAKLDENCDQLEQSGIRAEPHVYVGDPAHEIEKAARENGSTMIVLGSSGKSGWKERWLGSIPQHIAERSIYPTLIVPPERAEN